MSVKTFGSNGKNISENTVKLKLEQNINKSLLQGFPNEVDWWGHSFGKMPKTFMKITKSAKTKFKFDFCVKTVEERGVGGGQHGGQANFSGTGGNPTPLGETLCCIIISSNMCRGNRFLTIL